MSGIAQMVVYPFLAASLTIYDYGVFLVILGIANIIGSAFGKELCNTRLICDGKAGELPESKMYLILLAGSCIGGAAVLFLISGFLYCLDVLDCFLVALLTGAAVARSYFFVRFRLVLDFRRLFFSNCVLVAGYLLGMGVFVLTGRWELVFLMGELLTLVYTLAATKVNIDLQHEDNRRYVCTTFANLSSSSLVGNIGSYFDRVAVPFLLGEEALALFFSASFFGKIAFLISQPMRTLIVTYMGKGKITLKRKTLLIVNGLGLALVGAFALLSLLLGDPITRLLYPTLIDQAAPYVQMANLAVVVYFLYTVNTSMALASMPSWWQMIFAVLRIVLYAALGTAFALNAGLGGYIAGVLVSNVLMGVITFCVAFAYAGKVIKHG